MANSSLLTFKRMTRPKRQPFSLDQKTTIKTMAIEVYEKKFKGKDQPQKKMALALGIAQTSVSAMMLGKYTPSIAVAEELATLAGYEHLADVIGPYPGSDGPESASFPNLQKCLDFFGDKRWPQWVISAARAGYFDDDVDPTEWPARLDTLAQAKNPTH